MQPVQRGYSPIHHSDDVFDLAFHPNDSSVLVSCSQDNTARIWRRTSTGLDLAAVLRGHQDAPLRIAFSNDGSLLAAGAANGVIKAWHTDTALADSKPFPISRAWLVAPRLWLFDRIAFYLHMFTTSAQCVIESVCKGTRIRSMDWNGSTRNTCCRLQATAYRRGTCTAAPLFKILLCKLPSQCLPAQEVRTPCGCLVVARGDTLQPSHRQTGCTARRYFRHRRHT